MEAPVSAPTLFSEGYIGPVRLRNRIVMAPVNTNFGDEQGFPTAKAVRFVRERAAGGAGALILEAMQVDRRSKIVAREMGLYEDRFIPALTGLTEAIHAEGAKAFVQLNHGGPKASYRLNGARCVSASAIPVKSGEDNVPRPLEKGEIAEIVGLHAEAAYRAQQAGFDGVELEACHFYLLSAFLSGHLNHRTDEYGGSVENRCRTVTEIIQAIGERCDGRPSLGGGTAGGSKFPVIVRFNSVESPPLDGGITAEEGREMALCFERAGAAAVHASAAVHPVNPDIERDFVVKVAGGPSAEAPEGCFVPFAAGIKARGIHIPVITVGKIFDPVMADSVIRDGQADFVALARGLIADPQWPNKAKARDFSSITQCIECRWCHTSMQGGGDIECLVNPNLS